MNLKSVRAFSAGIFFIALFSSACEMAPGGRLVMMPDPAFFGGRSGSSFNANGQPGNVSVALDISSLDQERVKEFNGRDGKSLFSLIGRPDFIRREGLAEIWQYRANACIFDLFLYGRSTNKKVQHAEVRGDGVDNSPARGCFAKLLQDRIVKKTHLAPLKRFPFKPAQVLNHTNRAIRLSGFAHIPAVQNKPVVCVAHIMTRYRS